MLISLFERCLKRRGVKEIDPYDWEKAPAGDNIPTTINPGSTPQSHAIVQNTIPKHPKQQTPTDNNQENIEPTDNKEVPLFLFPFHFLYVIFDFEIAVNRNRNIPILIFFLMTNINFVVYFCLLK